MTSQLHEAAEQYAALGWRLVPVIGKKPRTRWKTPPAWTQVLAYLDDPGTTGLAVVLGSRSGDLAARDFDDADAFERWKQGHPDLAEILPIVRTGRPDGGYHVYGTMRNCAAGQISGRRAARRRCHHSFTAFSPRKREPLRVDQPASHTAQNCDVR